MKKFFIFVSLAVISLYPHKDYLLQAQKFVDTYDIVDALIPWVPPRPLVPKKDRICRFCGRGYENTSFKKVAHLIPDLIGNKEFISDFECDECNHFFGKYENELGNYLSINRTINATKAKEGIPGFTSPGKTIKAKAETILGNDAIVISREDITNGAIKVDATTGEMRILFKRNAYSPLGVYKSMLKIALSLISHEEVQKDYLYALDFLMKRKNVILTSGCILTVHSLPFNYNLTPHAYLFRKKDATLKSHTHVMALYFQNMIIAIPIPLNKNDLFFYNQTIEISNFPEYPPLFFEDSGGMTIKTITDDFSLDEKIKGQHDEIIAQINPEDLARTAVLDTETGIVEKKDYNPGEIVKIIIMRNNKILDPKEFGKAVRKL